VQYGMSDSTETGGSATELSATDAWHGAAVDDVAYVRAGLGNLHRTLSGVSA
jgi:hypothetical protein